MSETPLPSGSLPAPRRHPVDRFLGPEEATGGPFALLGINPDAVTDDLVLSALDRQIERIARHPECDTPEADEVRLTLHAAAAQLLDPGVRRHLIARWRDGGSSSSAEPRSVHESPSPASQVSVNRLLEHDAVLSLGLYGGWNQQSLRRLLSIAHARGFDNTQVAETLRGLAAAKRTDPSTSASRAAQPHRPSAPRFASAASKGSDSRASRSPASPPAAPTSSAGVTREERYTTESLTPAPAPASAVVAPAAAAADSAGLQSPGAARRPAARAAQPISEPLEDEIDPGSGLILRAAVFTLVGAVALGLCAAVVLWVVSTPTAPVPPVAVQDELPVERPTELAEVQQAEAAPAKPTPAAPPRRRIEVGALAQEITASAEALAVDPAIAGERLAVAIESLAAKWPQLPPDVLIACHDGIVEFVYLAGRRQEVVTASIDVIGAGSKALAERPSRTIEADEVLPAIWSIGMLARLTREKDLPLSTRLAVEGHLITAFGTAAPAIDRSFRAGASSAFLRIPHRLVPSISPESSGALPQAMKPDAWKQWAEAVESFAADRESRNRMLLVGLETLLIKGPEPNEHRIVSDIVTDLVARLNWREGDEPRRWLLRSFGDRLITNADLNAVTSALATRSSAEGVDYTMVLSTGASDRVRADLRERYATQWNVTDLITREEAANDWIMHARGHLDQPFVANRDIDLLGRVALFARLNQAAHLQWRGDQSEASLLLTDLEPPIHAEKDPPDLATASIVQRSAWAERYIAARQSVRARRDMLEELVLYFQDFGDVDAAILVQEATSGSPPEVRLMAIEAVKKQADSPAVVNALLDRVSRMPRITSNSNLIQHVCGRALPNVRDESWPVEARRILIEKLVETVSTRGPMARVDGVSELLAEAYEALSATRSAGTRSSSSAQSAASLAWSTWRSAAEPLIPSVSPPFTLSQIERRRAGRLNHARGPVQQFAAEQVSVCELFAYIVTCERPGRAEAIRKAMRDLGDERRAAMHIFHQMIATERAMTKLWLIRIEPEDPV